MKPAIKFLFGGLLGVAMMFSACSSEQSVAFNRGGAGGKETSSSSSSSSSSSGMGGFGGMDLDAGSDVPMASDMKDSGGHGG